MHSTAEGSTDKLYIPTLDGSWLFSHPENFKKPTEALERLTLEAHGKAGLLLLRNDGVSTRSGKR